MDAITMDDDFLELSSGDMRDMWDTSSLLETSLTEGDGEWSSFEDRVGGASVILRDRMITEASLPIRSEHSYCNDVSDPLRLPHIKLEDDMESECYPAISMSTATSGGGSSGGADELVTRPDTPPMSSSSRTVSSASSEDSGVGSIVSSAAPVTVSLAVTNVSSIAGVTTVSGITGVSGVSHISPAGGASGGVTVVPAQRPATAAIPRRLVLTQQSRDELQLIRAERAAHPTHIKISAGQSVLRPQTIVLTTSRPSLVQRTADSGAMPRLSVKLEPNTAFVLPPTPPSSVDSDGGSSPPYAGPSRVSPVQLQQARPKVLVTAGRPPVRHVSASLISTTPQRSAHGTLYLTEEEKRTLISEGYSVPSRLPLTKAEERSLKKIRRKIKNKISAQESRRKKKEYMDQMERRLDQMAADNEEYRRRLEQLETQRHRLSASNAALEQRNATLSQQLEQLRTLLGPDCPQIKEEAPEVITPN